nr:DegT/DnrJ/EryC1/StrS aminotransferase family protein [Clostridium sp. CF011]
MKIRNIPFSPPDITDTEKKLVMEVLDSGWITSGPKAMEFEDQIAKYCHANNAVALSSASAGLELILKVYNICEGDEVITTPYTYTATASVIIHRGVKPTFVDVKEGSFLIDEQKLGMTITPKTKAIITVDFAGVPVDYDAIKEVLREKNREDIIFISDSAHSFGAIYKGNKVGTQADFNVFSFHAVKNLTTSEGGAIVFNDNKFKGKEDLLREFKITSYQGQSKDTFAKMKAGAWKYDIITDGMKCNMTDISAAIGISQLQRYEGMIEQRRDIFNVYTKALETKQWAIIPFIKDENRETSYHLYPLRVKGINEIQRDEVVQKLADISIATNVHFTPLPMFTLYKNLGYSIKDYPNAYNQYANEITLPVYSTLKLEDAEYVVQKVIRCVEEIMG